MTAVAISLQGISMIGMVVVAIGVIGLTLGIVFLVLDRRARQARR
jgi:hypothetical protein